MLFHYFFMSWIWIWIVIPHSVLARVFQCLKFVQQGHIWPCLKFSVSENCSLKSYHRQQTKNDENFKGNLSKLTSISTLCTRWVSILLESCEIKLSWCPNVLKNFGFLTEFRQKNLRKKVKKFMFRVQVSRLVWIIGWLSVRGQIDFKVCQ